MSNNETEDATSNSLTRLDFVVACQALAETHNNYLDALNTGETINEYTEEQLQYAIQNIHATFVKFQAILIASTPQEAPPNAEEDATESTEEE